MSMLQLVSNPRRRKRRAGSAHKRRKSHRRMTAKQLKYFGPRKARRASRRTHRRSNRAVVIHANPSRRRRSSKRRSARRSFRRNPISISALRPTMASVVRVAQNAAVGAVGAVGVDIAMAQAGRFLPASMSARYDAAGNMNYGYYLTKAGLAVALGIVGARFAPGRLKGIAARMTEGSLTVQGYDLLRSMLPASLTLGYYNPAAMADAGSGLSRVSRLARLNRGGVGKYVSLGRMGASFPAGSAFSGSSAEPRTGEGRVQ
jgi:hypothetical protein